MTSVGDLRAHGGRLLSSRSRKCSRPKVRPGVVTTRRHAEQDARHEAAVVQGVVADGEGLALAAEQHLLVGEQAAQPYGVHRDAVDVGAAGAVQGRAWWRRAAGRSPASRAGRGDQLGGAGGGAGGGVGLVRVVQLDDLDGLEVAARPAAANFMVRTAPMEKFGAMSTPVSGEAASQPLQLREALVGPAGGADDARGCRGGRRSRGCPSPRPGWSARRRPGRRPRPASPACRPGRGRRPAPCRRRPRRPRTASEPIRPLAPRTATRSLLIFSASLTDAGPGRV